VFAVNFQAVFCQLVDLLFDYLDKAMERSVNNLDFSKTLSTVVFSVSLVKTITDILFDLWQLQGHKRVGGWHLWKCMEGFESADT